MVAGIAAFRWAAWAWMATVALISRHELRRPWLAVVLVALALSVSVGATALLRTHPDELLRPLPVAAELAVGCGLVLGDGFAYQAGHAFSPSQSLGVAWPLAGVLAVGAALNARAGGAAGIPLGVAKVGAVLANGVHHLDGRTTLSLASTAVLYAVGGAAAGHVTALLRRAEGEISAARAREEVARRLHDGVLQTLAVIERRSDDPALARLARVQERDLREWLFGSAAAAPPQATDLGRALRAAAARFEDAFSGRATVVLSADLPSLPADEVDAVAGAVGEVLVNAGKHGRAQRVTVFVEPDGRGIFCSVKDDGAGFDSSSVTDGVGLRQSIRQRISDAGGRVEVESRPGAGTEVRIWLP